MRVIFAYSDTDPSSENAVTYHGKTRGVKSITLRAKLPVPPVLPSDAFYQDLINKNVSMKPIPYWPTLPRHFGVVLSRHKPVGSM